MTPGRLSLDSELRKVTNRTLANRRGRPATVVTEPRLSVTSLSVPGGTRRARRSRSPTGTTGGGRTRRNGPAGSDPGQDRTPGAPTAMIC
eukprot:69983-Hanusia_phi.AAC.1